MELFNLKNKVAIVFGGNGQLGKQFCKALLEYGTKVYSCDVNVKESSETKKLRKKYNVNFQLVKVDATSKKELVKLKDYIVKDSKRVDILVNSTTAKGDDFYLPFEDVSLEGWDKGMLGNLSIPFLTIQTFVPVMKKQKSGSIINIASHYGLVGNDQRIYEGTNLHKVYVKNSPKIKRIYSHGVYNAAKGGLINFTRYLAAYYGEYNIRVNCISPGGIYNPKEDKKFVKNYSDKVPLGRKANVDEVNGALVFLASDASSYVTGHNLVVDGGFTVW
ncbi:MAG: SDR family oxidoreductase [Nanoarchaeota archaeon]|nr:SDR family oxidoreductase [DPANN group archaeon]MBL7116680.1 SDR family oxidoreductase [Nanoarchaeota archaeon]